MVKQKEPIVKMIKINTIETCFNAHEETLLATKKLFPVIRQMAEICQGAMITGHKILICGNGGSAADAQHIAAEFIGRFHSERRALPAIALSTDTSILTSIANDYDYSQVFSRQVQGLGRAGDVFWGISTSGNSENVNKAIIEAKNKRMITIASTGKTGGEMVDICDVALVIPSDSTARIQEMHILCAHIICQLIDDLDWGK